MEEGAIAQRLRAARELRGWTREALAYHSHVSWAAIAQIESGRRKDVRLSSLAALAKALEVSVDYLVLGRGVDFQRKSLKHRALIYRTDEEFRAVAVPFLNEGLERADALCVVTSRANRALLEHELGERRADINFVDSNEWYDDPSSTLIGYRRLIDEKLASGFRWVRLIGEPLWVGRAPEEVNRWHRYESMINLAFASSRATILCPYDARSVPPAVLDSARRTHPELAMVGTTAPSPSYQDPEAFLLGAEGPVVQT
jgi:transcriptional regulator with XRE-family HTH domain